MRYLSVCSGIEAATAAWHQLVWKAVAFAEVESFPSAVLAHHYPAVPNWGDITKFAEWPDANVDLLVGGTPCQSFSVAGLRRGLDDPRGNLMLVYLAIARRYRPQWIVWENVPGVLSSNGGRDFGTFLGGLAELGYGFAYRVLDAQYVRVESHARAVPQRRRRVFVVGHLGDWRRAAAVLLERESLRWHPPPRREAGEGIAPTISARTKGGGGLGTDFDCDGGLIAPDVDGAVTQRIDRGGVNSEGGDGHLIVAPDVARCDATREGSSQDWESTTMVAHSLRAQAQAQAQAQASHRADSETYVAHCLRGDGFDAGEDGTGRGTPLIAFDTTQITSASNYSKPRAGDPCHPLASGQHPPAIALAFKENMSMPSVGVGETLQAENYSAVSNGMMVRRLTPRECERLQGFPDDFTLIQVRGKPAADGPRYKALGNSMAVNCMSWLGQRIALVERTANREDIAA